MKLYLHLSYLGLISFNLKKKELTYSDVKRFTPVRLEKAGYGISKDPVGNGNCFISATLDQMKYVFKFICLTLT